MRDSGAKDISVKKSKSRLINLSLALASVAFTCLVIEIVLRIWFPHEMYQSLAPNEGTVQAVHMSKIIPDLDSSIYNSVNPYGYRSPNFFEKSRHGILAIGASTTYCIGLSDKDTWPWILDELLNQSSGNQRFTVGNVGVPSLNSGHHLYQLTQLQPQYENVKTVLVLLGVNDFLRAVQMEDQYLSVLESPQVMSRSFVRLPRKSDLPWYKRNELYLHIRDRYNTYKSNRNRVNLGHIEALMDQYESASKTRVLPDLDQALKDYESSLRKMAQEARELGFRLIFITQPTLWKDEMTKFEIRLASIGVPVIDGETYSMQAMAQGMDIFNQKLIEVSRDESIDYIDLARFIPKDTTAFFDWCHYSKSGARQVARVIYENLGLPDITKTRVHE